MDDESDSAQEAGGFLGRKESRQLGDGSIKTNLSYRIDEVLLNMLLTGISCPNICYPHL